MKYLIIYSIIIAITLSSCKTAKQTHIFLSDGRVINQETTLRKDKHYKKLKIASVEEINNNELSGKRRLICLDSKGYYVDIENNLILKNTFSDSNFIKNKLPETIIPEEVDRIITYGQKYGGMQYYLGLVIFDKRGKLIKQVTDPIAEFPYSLAVDKFGNTYIAGKDFNHKSNFFVWKYDSNGNKLWNVPIDTIAPYIYISNSGDRILVSQFNENQSTKVFNTNGEPLATSNIGYAPVCFLDSTRFVNAQYQNICTYSFNDSIKPVFYNWFEGKSFNKYPFTISKSKGWLTLLTIKENNDVILFVYDLYNLSLLGSIAINNVTREKNSNPILISSEGLIQFRTRNKIYKLTMD